MWTQTLTPFETRHWDRQPVALLVSQEHAAKSVSLAFGIGPIQSSKNEHLLFHYRLFGHLRFNNDVYFELGFQSAIYAVTIL